jgi:hypothetical protein
MSTPEFFLGWGIRTCPSPLKQWPGASACQALRGSWKVGCSLYHGGRRQVTSPGTTLGTTGLRSSAPCCVKLLVLTEQNFAFSGQIPWEEVTERVPTLIWLVYKKFSLFWRGLCLLAFVFWDRVSLCSPDWPWILEPPASVSWVLDYTPSLKR